MIVQRRSARVDRALTYAVPADMLLAVGDVVRVPLGPRQLYGYVVGAPREVEANARLREVAGRVEGPPAFDAEALELARWMAERYCCSLDEALGTLAIPASVPRVTERFSLAAPLDAARFPRLPPRLLRLIAGDLREGFSMQTILRHPEARRAGDRATLQNALATLVRAGVLVRARSAMGARIGTRVERVLEATGRQIRGPRAAALVERVRAAGELRRRDALLEGFSAALLARAVREGALRETERPVAAVLSRFGAEAHDFTPTAEQRAVLERIVAALAAPDFRELLLQGVTGSGKTFVYIRAIAQALARGQRAIVLVPEISLTPQTARRFEGAFGARVAVLHSGLSERERFETWQAAARNQIDVIVGARSAVFAPLEGVGLIVVDEAHERTYKQDTAPRYHAIDVARERMRRANGVLIVASATPPLETYAAALAGDVEHLRLHQRATGARLPVTHVVDMAREFAGGNRRMFSNRLIEAIEARLARDEKVVLFVNRRGSASFMLCRRCGDVPRCTRCSISLTVHRAEGLLRCHLCDAQGPIPPACRNCGGGPVREFGVGTQRVAEVMGSIFPSARVVRMDSDTTTRVGDHARLLEEFAARGDVLVGTQMIAKGLDFPTVTLVGVVAADVGLHAPDFRAAERTFDLLTQVAGRSGRSGPGEAIVQTYSPEHAAVAHAARHDFDAFAAGELELRRELRYPPYGALVYLGVVGRRRTAALEAATRYAEELRDCSGVEVLGPAPYPIARVNDEWRFRIALKTDVASRELRAFIRERLQARAASDKGTRLVVNVDP